MNSVPKHRILNMYRTWKLTLPQHGSDDWNKLVRLVTSRNDMRVGFWTDELIVSSLVADAELNGANEVSYPVWNEAEQIFDKHVLARVEWAPNEQEPVYNPEHWKVSLEPTEREMDASTISEAYGTLRQIMEGDNVGDDTGEKLLVRKVVHDLTEYADMLEANGA